VIEVKSSNVSAFVKSFQRQILLAGLVVVSSSVLLLSGCSSAFTSGSNLPGGPLAVAGTAGKVHGGQQPVTLSTVSIYSVSAAGSTYGGAATLMGTPVTTGVDGSWSYGSYICASSSDELYVVSSGGNPGLGAGMANKALVLTAALGPCSGVSAATYVYIDEVTTVATDYALAGFMTDYTHVGSSTTAASTTGLANAFATVNNLVNISTGQALTTTPGYIANTPTTPPDTYRSIVPTDTINTLANVLASCVNTGTSDSSTPAACTSLFALTGGVTNTSDAALYIAHNPGLPQGDPENTNLAAVYALSTAQSPFQPTLGAQPNDFTLTLNFTGGGLGGATVQSRSGSTYIAIDETGNVWIPNGDRHSITELSNLGVPLSPTTTIDSTTHAPLVLGGWQGGLLGPQEVAIDQNGNAWVSDDQNCVAGFNSSGAPLTNSPFTAVCGTNSGAKGIAVDSNNHVWTSGTGFISSATSTGTLVSGFPVASGFNTLTGFLGSDYLGNVWWIDEGSGHFGALTPTGGSYADSASGPLSGPGSFAAFGALSGGAGLTLWIPQGQAGTLNMQPANATLANINNLPSPYLPNTESSPNGIAADGNSLYYFANGGGGTAPSGGTIPPNVSVVTKGGALASPYTTGYTGGSGLTALKSPQGVAIDQSGNVWVVNLDDGNPAASGQITTTLAGTSNVTEFVGLAAPVNPVLSLAAKNQTYGTKP